MNANLPMLTPTFPNERDDAGNRDRHAGTDATGNNPDVSSPEPVPTRIPAWRSFLRKHRYRNRVLEDSSSEINRPVFHRIRSN
jgi:hypothetical protein